MLDGVCSELPDTDINALPESIGNFLNLQELCAACAHSARVGSGHARSLTHIEHAQTLIGYEHVCAYDLAGKHIRTCECIHIYASIFINYTYRHTHARIRLRSGHPHTRMRSRATRTNASMGGVCIRLQACVCLADHLNMKVPGTFEAQK